MAAWSRLFLSGSQRFFKPSGILARVVPKNDSVRCMSGHNTLTITASRWQWHKTKDWLHFYFWVGLIPISIFVFSANVFVGPATLEPIPEGHVPKHWEYYRSPVVRLFARYLFSQPQKEYEKGLYFIVHDMDVKQMRDLQRQVKEYIRNEQDYPAFGYHSGIQATMVKEYRKRVDEQRV